MNYPRYWVDMSDEMNICPQGIGHIDLPYEQAYDKMVIGDLLEVGCGPGRLCSLFSPAKYKGVDINKYWIEKAKEAHPEYEFEVIAPFQKLEHYPTVLLHTVLLHIPDHLLQLFLDTLKYERLIVTEIMDRRFRQTSPGYNISNQRDVLEYDEILGDPVMTHAFHVERYNAYINVRAYDRDL